MLRPVQIKHYLKVMEARGFTAEQVLAGSGIEPQRVSDPAYLLDSASCKIVIANMLQLTGDQGIGLDVGGEARLTDFGIVAHAMMSSRTLGEAISLWLRYGNLVGMIIRLQMDDSPGPEWTVNFLELEPAGFAYRFFVEEILVAGITIASTLTDHALDVSRICLSYPPPEYVERYRRQFSCRLRFNAPLTSITVRSPHLNTPLRTKDEELRAICVEHCQRIMRQLSSESDIIARVRSILLKNPVAIPDLRSMAEMLGTSERSLRRHLQQSGTSYRNLVAKFRAGLALEYLNAGSIPPKEIAYLLGFNDVNAFRRAFKSWTGHTICSYRRQRGSESSILTGLRMV